jgi:AcrR family transcriptional regulator
VSTRTFFRYFPSKESVLFVQERRWGESFAQSFVRQPATSTDIEAIRDTLVESASGQKRGRLRLYERAAASSAALRGQGVEQQRVELELLGTLLAERRGVPWPDEGCRLLAEVGIVTYRRALDRWLATDAGHGLAEIILDEFRLLGRQFASD